MQELTRTVLFLPGCARHADWDASTDIILQSISEAPHFLQDVTGNLKYGRLSNLQFFGISCYIHITQCS